MKKREAKKDTEDEGKEVKLEKNIDWRKKLLTENEFLLVGIFFPSMDLYLA